MRVPSSKKLQETFDISAKEANLIRKFAKAVDDPDALEKLVEKVPGTDRYVRSLHRDPYDSPMWRTTVVLHAINELVEGYGVEAIEGEDDGDFRSGPDYEYVNMGDSYATTLIYDRDKDRLFISTYGDEVERMGNPRKSLKGKAKPTPACGPGQVLIQRKGYTKADGTYVVPTAFCQTDQGRPGVRSFGAKSASGKYADRADMPPLIRREGKLGGPGYTERPAKTRRAILKRCVKGGKMKLDGETFDSPAYGYRSCLGSLQVLLRNSEMGAKKRKVIESDVKWLEKNYGGRRGNSEPKVNTRALKARLLK